MGGTFKDLQVWQVAMQLAYAIYGATQGFPKDELYGIVAQMRRSAVSIPSNIAEGKGRTTKKELIHFLCHSRGSNYELQTQILIAEHLGFLTASVVSDLKTRTDQVGKMLNVLISFQSAADSAERKDCINIPQPATDGESPMPKA